VIAGVLLLHGFGHGGALGALLWIGSDREMKRVGGSRPLMDPLAVNLAVLVTQLVVYWPQPDLSLAR
jgi:hypothetical protein